MNAVSYYIIKSVMQDWKYLAGVSINKSGSPENIYAMKERIRLRTTDYLIKANELKNANENNFNIQSLMRFSSLKRKIHKKIAEKNVGLAGKSEIILLNNEKIPLKESLFTDDSLSETPGKYNYADIVNSKLNYTYQDYIIICSNLIGGILKNESADNLKHYSFDWKLIALYSSMENYEYNLTNILLENIDYQNLSLSQKNQLFDMFLKKMYEEEDIAILECIIKIHPESIVYFDDNFDSRNLVEEDEEIKEFIKKHRTIYEKSQLNHISVNSGFACSKQRL